ncbi:MAG TPA: ABC transporter substrate-binding protein [Chloroflexia bacterium]|nr:ABC transporter substrate-binding protein [Chloroflexia bacterium]
MFPPKRGAARRIAALYASVCVLILALAAGGCNFNPTPVLPEPTKTPVRTATPTQPPRAPGGTLTVRMAGDVQSFNPWLTAGNTDSENISGLLFSGLTRLDNHLMPVPDLAESWDVSEDGTSIVFHLRSGVLWHDGKPFTAEDVVWSYKILTGIRTDNPSQLHILDTVASVDAIDPVTTTVRFKLKRRYSPLLADLSVAILPSHILSGTTPQELAESPFNASPVGTGPFTFEKHTVGESVILKANPRYFGGAPALERVGFLVADEPTAVQAIQDGKLLFARLSPGAAEQVVKDTPGSRGGAYDELGYDFVAFNLRAPRPFSDTRLRKAWALALDKPGLAFQATGGGGDPLWSDVNKASWAYNLGVSTLGGNPDEARRLIAEAGWQDTNGDGIVEKAGKPLEVSLFVRPDNAVRRKAAEGMVAPLARVGIRVRVELADFNTALLARISPLSRPPFDFDVALLGWTRRSVDPDPFALFHSSQIPTEAAPGLLNFTGFAAPEYDSLVLEANSTYDFGRRKELYARLQAITAGELPYYFLWAEKFGLVAGPKLKGDIDFSSPRYLWNAAQWYIEP